MDGAQNGMWTNSANWSVSPYAGYNYNEKATFDGEGNGNTVLDIAGLYSIGSLTFDTENVASYTLGAGAVNSQTLVMGGSGLYYLSATAGHSQLFNATLQLGGNNMSGSYFFRNDSPAEVLTFAWNVTAGSGQSAGTKTMSLSGEGSLDFSGSLSKSAAAALVVTNGLDGTLTLSDAGSLTALASVSVATGGVLNIANSGAANLADRLADAAPVTLAGGTLAYAHSGGAFSYGETLGGLVVAGPGSVVSVSQADEGYTSSLTFAGLTRANGGTVNFAGAGLGEDGRSRIFIAGQPDGLIGLWATVNAEVADNAPASSLFKDGAGDVQLRGAVSYSGPTVINAGRLTFYAHAVTQTVAGVVSGSGALAKGGTNAALAAVAGTVTLAANASGGLTKTGAGTLTLTGANTYTGTLDLGGLTFTNAVVGSGTLTNGTAVAVLSPGGEGTVATNALTLLSASVRGTYRAEVTAGGACDLLTVQGVLDLSKLSLSLVNPAQLDNRRSYTILACTGGLTGRFAAANLPDSHWHVVVLADGTVRLVFSKGTVLLMF